MDGVQRGNGALPPELTGSSVCLRAGQALPTSDFLQVALSQIQDNAHWI